MVMTCQWPREKGAARPNRLLQQNVVDLTSGNLAWGLPGRSRLDGRALQIGFTYLTLGGEMLLWKNGIFRGGTFPLC